MTTPRPAAVPSWCSPRLRVVTPDGITTCSMWIDLPPGDAEITIGRDAGAAIRLTDPWASRRHATLSIRGGHMMVADLGSRWGTRLNAAPIAGPLVVADGDAIVIGATAIVVEHAWRGPALAHVQALGARDPSSDGLALFDSVARGLPLATGTVTGGEATTWERWTGLAATVLLAGCAAVLAWRLLAGD